MYDYLVVGSGLYGAIFAHEAKAHGKSVLVVDKRPNIAGNIYTENIEGINQCTNQTIIHPLITPHPEERIWAGRTPRAPDAPKIKHNGMKRFYMVDMGVKNVILSFYQKKCESLSLAKEKSLSQ